MVSNDTLPPSCPEAERGVLGCCLLNTSKTGVSGRWFYDLRHIEIFNVLAAMARNGGGDSLVATTDITALLNMVDSVATTTGAAVVLPAISPRATPRRRKPSTGSAAAACSPVIRTAWSSSPSTRRKAPLWWR